jgi:hypothetical protein
VGIESVQVCTEEICVEFRRNKVTEYSVRRISARSASSRRTPRGREVFLVQEILRDSEFDEIPRTQGVHGRSKYSRRSSSEGITQRLQKSQTYSKSKAQRRDNATRAKRDQELGSTGRSSKVRPFEH